MFVINNETIRNEFDKTSWDHDFDKFCEITHQLHDEVTTAEKTFANDFSDKMLAAYVLCRNYSNEISGYFSIRDMLVENNLTPEDIEYGVFGNICAGAVDVSDPDDPDDHDLNYYGDRMDAMTSYGYMPAIDKIVSNDPYTIIEFADGTKTTVKIDKKDAFDAKTGILIALLKKAMGSRNLQHLFKLMSEFTDDSEPVINGGADEPELEFEGDDGSMGYESVDDWYNDWNKGDSLDK